MKNYCNAFQEGLIQEEINKEINNEMTHNNKCINVDKMNHMKKDYEIDIAVKDVN